ncbi:MAG: hypothetical protein A2074_03390 [Candidatus Aquicultor primus]|uniref:Uncharacterized protein n=1 Tax=Candidatus Aquicultor primus TaxID=1797195 RepID=A0A1F2UI41_9ACTN|nr:MAG: hypothetical protein A2074_03390 [Candidatus Aquicultor primus]
MTVEVDQAGHEKSVSKIKEFFPGIFSKYACAFADGDNATVLDQNRPMLDGRAGDRENQISCVNHSLSIAHLRPLRHDFARLAAIILWLIFL